MQRATSILVTGLFLCSSILARAQQSPSTPGPSGNQVSSGSQRDCSNYLDAAREATRNVERDRRTLAPQSDSAGGVQMNGDAALPPELRQDLASLKAKETAPNKCAQGKDDLNARPASSAGCSNEQLLTFQMSHEGDE